MTDARLRFPAVARNKAIIRDRLCRLLAGAEGHALELASGSGEHILDWAQALPGLTWWPSDIEPRHLESIAAWRACEGPANLMAPLRLDASAKTWPLGAPGWPPAAGLKVLLAVNLVHIAPWQASEGLFAGAGRHLGGDGLVILYGPFMRGGHHTAPSNAAFDQSLRQRNPAWGLRGIEDLEALARANGLALGQVLPVPANNFILAFSRA